jgi:hypothetical protein
VVDSGWRVRHSYLMTGGGEHQGRQRRCPLLLGVLTAAAVPLVVGAALAATAKPVVIQDAANDVDGPLDLQGAELHRSSDGRLRVILTFVGTVSAKTLLATAGPPGSVCLRIWTNPAADPRAIRPDRLVCVTARSEDELRAGVFQQHGGGLPRRIATAQARTNRSGRSFVVRMTQSSLGAPAVIRFAVESTRPGCESVACIDTAPEAGRIRTFRLR